MRSVFTSQQTLGQIDIADIKIDVTSRDDIPLVLLGLQHIYTTPSLKNKVFKILEEVIPTKQQDGKAVPVSSERGCPGMNQWTILVLGVLRLALNTNFDRIQELANQHKTLREMLGLSYWDNKNYRLQTIKDNLNLFTPAISARISAEVIRAGYELLDMDIHNLIRARCDSFVLKTHVHFPTDINLLYDAIRYLIHDCVKWNTQYPVQGWQQHQYNLRKFKQLYRKIQKLKHSTSQDPLKKQAKEDEIRQAHQDYIDLARIYLTRINASHALLSGKHKVLELQFAKAKTFVLHAERQIDQIRRRAIQGETIPHAEKVFSLFQPHTEWISKGKAGVPVELGLRVAIVESSVGFILHHQVMQNTTDDKIAVDIVKETQATFPSFKACSFDKGFHSPSNQKDLKDLLEQVTLPKKGKLSEADKIREYDAEFKQAKKQHSAVESAINALEVHGLDTCPDHGIDGFKRYVSLAVLSRNIQILGSIRRSTERQKLLEQKEAA